MAIGPCSPNLHSCYCLYSYGLYSHGPCSANLHSLRTCMHMRVHTSALMSIHICIPMSAHVPAYMGAHMRAHISICISMHISICISMHMSCACLYTYLYTCSFAWNALPFFKKKSAGMPANNRKCLHMPELHCASIPYYEHSRSANTL